jgi:DNA end-binding protein Ku
MRSMWAGVISFGLISIPIKLYAATEQRDVAFRQVHRADGGKITFRRVCSACGEEVPYSDVAKGYELPSGDMVVLTDEDLASLPVESEHRIEVLHFTPGSEIDPIFQAKSYYLEPESSGTRAYVLLREAMERTGKVAVVKVTLRQRESLASMRVKDGVIVLQTLLWPEEVREPDFGFLEEDVEVRSQELKMATSLIDTMTEDFSPAAHHDRYREELEDLVREKVAGRDVVAPPSPQEEPASEGPGHPPDLAETLRASVAVAKSRRQEQADRRHATA